MQPHVLAALLMASTAICLTPRPGLAGPDAEGAAPAASPKAASDTQVPDRAENVTVVPELGRTADVEDVTGHTWRLSGVHLSFSGSFMEPGPNRFQSVKPFSDAKATQPLILRVGSTDLLVPLDALRSIEKRGDCSVDAVYDWNGVRQTVRGDLKVPQASYERYDLEGTSITHGTAVRLALLDVKTLVLDPSTTSSETDQASFRLPPLTATIHLKGGGTVRVGELARVFTHSPYCYHDRQLIVTAGKGRVTVPFSRLASFSFVAPADELHLVYRAGPPEMARLWKGDTFDNEFVGLTGFSEIGEVFVPVESIASVELAGGSQ